jgi:hypothetical protein
MLFEGRQKTSRRDRGSAQAAKHEPVDDVEPRHRTMVAESESVSSTSTAVAAPPRLSVTPMVESVAVISVTTHRPVDDRGGCPHVPHNLVPLPNADDASHNAVRASAGRRDGER